MAIVKLAAPLKGIKGSLGKESPYYYRQRNGKIFLCCKPGATAAMRRGSAPYKAPKRQPTPAQESMRERFKLLHKAAGEICASPTLRAYFEDLYMQDKKAHGSLQTYVMRQINLKTAPVGKSEVAK